MSKCDNGLLELGSLLQTCPLDAFSALHGLSIKDVGLLCEHLCTVSVFTMLVLRSSHIRKNLTSCYILGSCARSPVSLLSSICLCYYLCLF